MIGKMLKKEQPAPLDTPSFSLSEHVHARPELQADLEALAAAETRLAESTARKQRLSALRRGATAAAPTLTAGQLIAGEREPGWSLDGEIVACENEMQTLRAEIADRAEKIAVIKRELDFRICKQFAAENAANHHATLHAMVTLRDALQKTVALHMQIRAVGYSVNETALPSNFPWATYHSLNDPRHPDGAVGMMRAFIEEKNL